MELIKKFSDDSLYEFREGDFNKYCIFYVDGKGNERQLDGEWILRVAFAFGKRHDDKRLKFNSMINRIGESEYKNRVWLDDIVKKYELEFKEDKLTLEKISYLMLAIFHAEDNWTNPETGKHTIFGRRIYLSAIKRVGVLGQDVDKVYNLYGKGQLASVIESLICETNITIEKMTQPSLSEWF